MGKLKYIPALDGLRGIAVLAVMGYHLQLPFFGIGNMGVDLFFVLSGFLITTLLTMEHEREGSIDLARFYFRRVLRLFPALVMVIAAACIAISLFGSARDQSETILGAWSSLLFMSNWALLHSPFGDLGALRMTWSLAIEDQFYIIWAPLLTFLLWRRTPRPVLLAILGAGALGSAIVCALNWSYVTPGAPLASYFSSDSRAQELIVGCLFGLLYTWNWLPDTPTFRLVCKVLAGLTGLVIVTLSIAIQIPGSLPNVSLYNGGLLVVCFGFAGLIMLAIRPGRLASILSFKPLVWVGSISYGLYLWHFPVVWLLSPERSGLSPFISMPVSIAISFALATASYYLVEQRFLRLKQRLGPGHVGKIAVKSATNVAS